MLWISDQWKDYEVLDASEGERLERWGKYVLVRPDPQVIWATPHDAPDSLSGILDRVDLILDAIATEGSMNLTQISRTR